MQRQNLMHHPYLEYTEQYRIWTLELLVIIPNNKITTTKSIKYAMNLFDQLALVSISDPLILNIFTTYIKELRMNRSLP